MTHPFQPRRLADMLLARGLASPAQVAALPAGGEARVGEGLVRDGVLSAEQLAQLLAEQFGLPYVDLDGLTVSAELFERLPAAQAYELNAVPVGRSGDSIEIAIADPYDLALPDRLERVRRCVTHYATPDGRIIPCCAYNTGHTHRTAVEAAHSMSKDEYRARRAAQGRPLRAGE